MTPDQIRLVMKTFRDNLPEIFPGRETVPKTLVFAKDDNHAEEITKITREVFGKGNEFCQKITSIIKCFFLKSLNQDLSPQQVFYVHNF